MNVQVQVVISKEYFDSLLERSKQNDKSAGERACFVLDRIVAFLERPENQFKPECAHLASALKRDRPKIAAEAEKL